MWGRRGKGPVIYECSSRVRPATADILMDLSHVCLCCCSLFLLSMSFRSGGRFLGVAAAAVIRRGGRGGHPFALVVREGTRQLARLFGPG